MSVSLSPSLSLFYFTDSYYSGARSAYHSPPHSNSAGYEYECRHQSTSPLPVPRRSRKNSNPYDQVRRVFFAWKSIQFFTKCRWILTVTLSLPRVKNVKIWCFELCKVSNSNVSIIKPCAHPANLEYLVANSWCLQKPYSMFEDPGAVSWVRKYGGERFQERVRDPLGRYS